MAQKVSEQTRGKRQPGGRHRHGPVQAVAGGMAGWFLGLAVSLGLLGVGAAYYGLLVAASTLISVFFVLLTLYLFLRFWPEEEPIVRRTPEPAPAAPRQAKVQAVQANGPPRVRFMVALKDVVRRQDAFRLSPQGAERFARTIRYILRSDQDRPS
jgi:hypothetical protein